MQEYVKIYYICGAVIAWYLGYKLAKKKNYDEPYVIEGLFVTIYLVLALIITYVLEKYFGY